jgi:large subunit ribosomal protein L29
MNNIMDIKELKNKPAKELHRLLALQREKLRELRFKDANKQLKNVKEIKSVKKIIARILTLLNKHNPNPQMKSKSTN